MTEKTEPILVDNDQAGHEAYIRGLRNLSAKLENFKPVFNEFAKEVGLPMFNKEMFCQIKQQGGLRSLENQIDVAVSKKDRAVQKLYLEDFYKLFNLLKEPYREIEFWFQTTAGNYPEELKSPEFIPFDNNGIEVTPGFIEETREKFKLVISDPISIEFHQKYMEVANSWNGLLDFIKENNIQTNNIHMASFNQMYSVGPVEKRATANPKFLFKTS